MSGSQADMTGREVGKPDGAGRIALVWFAVNLLIGYAAIFPLSSIVTFTYYVRAVLGHDVVAPYGPNPSSQAALSAGLIVVQVGILTTIAVLFNRRQWRRITKARASREPGRDPASLTGGHVAVYAVAAVAVQLLPFTLYMVGTDRTLPPFIG